MDMTKSIDTGFNVKSEHEVSVTEVDCKPEIVELVQMFKTENLDDSVVIIEPESLDMPSDANVQNLRPNAENIDNFELFLDPDMLFNLVHVSLLLVC